MRKNAYLIVVIAIAMLACIDLSRPCTVSAAALHGTCTIRDMAGRTLTVPEEPQRIVSTSPGVTEILFSLGLQGRIAGVTTHCNYPPEAKNLPKIGSMHPGIERIVQLKPDLIVADRSLKIDSAAKLEKMGYPVLIVDCSTLEQFKRSLVLLGKATGREHKGKTLKRRLEDGIAKVERKIGAPGTVKRIRIFVEIWDRPLMTAGPRTFFNDLIALSGGENVFADARSDYPKVNIESLIQREPQVIILTTSKKADVMKRTSWSRIEAVQRGKVYEINPDIISRPTLRMLEALETIARWIHPESFKAKKVTISGSPL